MYSKRLRVVFAIASLFAFAVHVSASSARPRATGKAEDVAAIQDVFTQYKKALLEGDGPKAADLMSAQTIAFYEGIVGHSLNTPASKLADLDFLAKFMVLRIRLEFDKAEITKMTGRELLILGVNKGWISKASVSEIGELVSIKVDGWKATAAMPAAPAIPIFHFLKESGRWRLDLLSSFELANAAIGQEVEKSGLTEEQFIMRTLSVLSSKKVDDRILSVPRD